MQKRKTLPNTLAINLKTLRKQCGMTQKDVTEKLKEAGLEITQQSYNRYENNNASPDYDTLLKLADVFNTDVNTLVGYRSKDNSPLQQALHDVRKMGFTAIDKGNGVIEYGWEDKDEKLEAVLTYGEFMDIYKHVAEEAQDTYDAEFIMNFRTGYFLEWFANYNTEKVTYTPKNQNAYNFRKEWIEFNKLKERRSKQSKDFKAYYKNLIERAQNGDQQAEKEYKELIERLLNVKL